MVLKHYDYLFENLVEFENDVKMYGTQTSVSRRRVSAGFENDVKMYGTQTIDLEIIRNQ